MGLIDSPLCRRCGAEGETSVHVLRECEALTTLRHTYLGSSFLDPDDVRSRKSRDNLELFSRDRAPMNWFAA
jgi:hypothetical protein